MLQRAGSPLPCSRSRVSLRLCSPLVSSSRLPHLEFVVRSLYQRSWALPRDTSARFVLHSFPSPHPQTAKHGGRGFPSPARTVVRAAPAPSHRTHSAGRWERGRRARKGPSVFVHKVAHSSSLAGANVVHQMEGGEGGELQPSDGFTLPRS